MMLESVDAMTWVLSPGISGWRAAMLRLADNRCFGLGPRERIASTADGTSWSSHCEGTKFSTDSDIARPEIRGIAFKDGVYVAVGTRGMVGRSVNRDSWTHVLGGGVRGFRRVFWMRGRLIALAEPGNLLSSVDGRSWTNHRAGNHPHELLTAVVDNGTLAVAVGKTVLISDDLVSWVETGVPAGKEFTSVTWDGTRFIAGSKDGGIYHSSDGASWNLELAGQLRIDDVAGINGMALALSGANIKSWTNAGPWLQVPNTWGGGDYRFLYADGTSFMATGSSSFSLWSADGRSWERLYHSSLTPGRVAKGAQGLYALSPDSVNNLVYRLLESQDGRQWSALPVSLPERGVNVIEQVGALLTFHEKGEVLLGLPLVSAAFQTEMLASGYPFQSDLSPCADANGDGIPNMVAHYFGLNVVNLNPVGIAALPKLEFAGKEEGVISVGIPTHGTSPSYLRAAIEAGEGLDDWEEVAVRFGAGAWTARAGGTISTDDDGDIMLNLPADPPSRFFRLKIEEAP
ncbi:MAG: hypothetical protein Q8Q59_12110 [Luteolibacter sp.]|nr:hypothetical protein [Luteolibacter sp.]